MWPLIGLVFGMLILGPLVCWLTGMFNPIGYLGYPPWHSEVKKARQEEAQRRRDTR